jgi:hypothetical protein
MCSIPLARLWRSGWCGGRCGDRIRMMMMMMMVVVVVMMVVVVVQAIAFVEYATRESAENAAQTLYNNLVVKGACGSGSGRTKPTLAFVYVAFLGWLPPWLQTTDLSITHGH